MVALPDSPPSNDIQAPKIASVSPSDRASPLSARELEVVTAIAEAAMPGGYGLRGASRRTAEGMNRWMADISAEAVEIIQAALWTIELGTVPTRRHMFSHLPDGGAPRLPCRASRRRSSRPSAKCCASF